MTFANIIREAGGSSKNFPNASQIPVTLYDGKDRVDTSESVTYIEPLFARNRREQSRFFQLVKDLEKTPVEQISVEIDAHCVVLFYKSPRARIFLREAN